MIDALSHRPFRPFGFATEVNDSPQNSQNADQILLFHNPKAGSSSRKERLDALTRALTDEGFDVLPICDLDQIGPKTTELIEQNRLYCVVSAGGDGTAAAVVNLTPAGTPVAIFPRGTENVFANICKSAEKLLPLLRSFSINR
ncbi:MAG: hypothetical protein COA78_37750 [Blastopirellula sp.]|nr:MAG: hypothetical protein COA78_37750 [Blastopirellula sp.]